MNILQTSNLPNAEEEWCLHWLYRDTSHTVNNSVAKLLALQAFKKLWVDIEKLLLELMHHHQNQF